MEGKNKHILNEVVHLPLFWITGHHLLSVSLTHLFLVMIEGFECGEDWRAALAEVHAEIFVQALTELLT